MTKEVSTNDVRSQGNLERTFLQMAIAREIRKIADDSKEKLHHQMRRGESLKVTNKRGGELGTIYRTQSKPRAVIADESVALAMADSEGAELEDRLPKEGSPAYWEAVEVIEKHAPHLIRVVLLEQERIAEEVLEDYYITGDVKPGWKISEGKPGYTAIRQSDVGKQIVENMVDGALGLLPLARGNDDE